MPSTPRSASRRASSTVCTPLTTTLPGHWSLIQAQVLVGHGRVEHRVEQLGDGARPPIERGEGERLGGQEVDPPRRPRDGVERRCAGVRVGRDRHAVALVAQPGAGHRHVDGDQQGVEAGLRRPVDQGHRPVAVLPHVELEPVATVRVGRRDVLDRRGAHRGQRERDAGRRGRGAPASSPSVCIIRVKPVGAMPNGSATGAPEHLREPCRPSRRRAGSPGGTRCPRTPVGPGPARSRPRRRPRCSRRRPSAYAASRSRAGPRWSAPSPAVASWRSARLLELHQRCEVSRLGQMAFDHGQLSFEGVDPSAWKASA